MKNNHATPDVVIYTKRAFKPDSLLEGEIELLMSILPELLQALEQEEPKTFAEQA